MRTTDYRVSDLPPYIQENIEIKSVTGCWEWTGSTRGEGYAQIRHEGKQEGGHRVTYKILVGPIPPKAHLDHLCRVHHCVNPNNDHIECVTPRINILRGIGPSANNAKKTHCPKGHPYDENNTYDRPTPSRPGRGCLACMREHDATRPDRGHGPRIKTHCKWGHEFTPENTYRGVDKSGQAFRLCRACGARRKRNERGVS